MMMLGFGLLFGRFDESLEVDLFNMFERSILGGC